MHDHEYDPAAPQGPAAFLNIPGTEPEPDREVDAAPTAAKSPRLPFRFRGKPHHRATRDAVEPPEAASTEKRGVWDRIPPSLLDGRRFETRVGLATLLSFAILVCALIASSRKKHVDLSAKRPEAEKTAKPAHPETTPKPAAPVAVVDRPKSPAPARSAPRDPVTPPPASAIEEPVAAKPGPKREEIVPPTTSTTVAASASGSADPFGDKAAPSLTPPPPDEPQSKTNIEPPASPATESQTSSDAASKEGSGGAQGNAPASPSSLLEPPAAADPSKAPTSMAIAVNDAPKANGEPMPPANPLFDPPPREQPTPPAPPPPPKDEPATIPSPATLPDLPAPPREMPKPPPSATDSAGWVTLPNLGKNYRASDGPVANPGVAKAAPEPPGDETPIQPVLYTAADGEDFAAIARKYYGSTRYAKALWSANRSKVATMGDLLAGTTIRVPFPESLDPSLIDSNESVSADAPRRDSEASRASDRPKDAFAILPVGRPSTIREATKTSQADLDDADFDDRPAPSTRFPTYVAVKGDTFRSIARKTLGNSERWEEIRRLNADVVDHPYRPRPGQKLKLPVDAKVAKSTN